MCYVSRILINCISRAFFQPSSKMGLRRFFPLNILALMNYYKDRQVFAECGAKTNKRALEFFKRVICASGDKGSQQISKWQEEVGHNRQIKREGGVKKWWWSGSGAAGEMKEAHLKCQRDGWWGLRELPLFYRKPLLLSLCGGGRGNLSRALDDRSASRRERDREREGGQERV